MSLRSHIVVENAVRRYILGSERARSRVSSYMPLVASVAKAVLSDVINCIDRGSCPYCGKVFSSRRSIMTHVLKSHRDELGSDIARVVDVYRGLVDMLVKRSSRVSVNLNGVKLSGNKTSIAKEIQRNPGVLRELGLV
jgi:hypothetical protein